MSCKTLLIILLNLVSCFTSITYPDFSVTYSYTSLNNAYMIDTPKASKSEVHCAYLCGIHQSCVASSFDNNTLMCGLYEELEPGIYDQFDLILRKDMPCYPNPCASGVCQDLITSFTCICPAGVTGVNCGSFSCTFETATESGCLFEHDPTSEIVWERHTGTTGSGSTGPTSAFEGSYYFYTEASSVSNGAIGRILWKHLQINCGASISFYYCMYGEQMGALKVYQDSNLLWQKFGNQGTSWKYVVINLAVNKLATSQIGIEGSRGTGFRSDIAIDDFKLTIETC